MKMNIIALLWLLSFSAFAEREITDNWFPLPAANNRFLMDHNKYARMLWAFDYGHALIYEQLWRNSLIGDFDFTGIEGPVDEPKKSILDQVLAILENPPTQAPTEDTLSPNFTMEFSWLMNMFSWSHKLHWVVYDVLAAETPERAKAILKAQTDEVYRRYPTLALPTQCKSMMAFMEGQPYSMRFRRNSPNANGLIWAYHYYQLALYEALLLPAGPPRDAMLAKVLKTFKKMAEAPADNVPEMPMARKVAPTFYKEYKDLAAIFDNLHEVHDVVGDILSVSEPVIIPIKNADGTDNQILKVAVPDNIKNKIPGDTAHVLVNYHLPEVKKAQMDWMMRLSLDNQTFLIDCDKNGHDD